MGIDKDMYIEYLEKKLREKEHIILDSELESEGREECDDSPDLEYEFDLLRARICNLEERIEDKEYVISSLINTIKEQESIIFDLKGF